MGLFASIATICILGLITLEGLNPTLQAQTEKSAAAFVGLLASQFKIDPKPILGLVPLLRFVALSALAAFFLRVHYFVLVAYLLFTRGTQLLAHQKTAFAAITQKGVVDGINSSVPDVTYILSTIGTIALLLHNLFYSGSKKCVTTHKDNKTKGK